MGSASLSDDAEPTSYYEPFISLHETIIALSNAAVHDRCAITLVCRQRRTLGVGERAVYVL